MRKRLYFARETTRNALSNTTKSSYHDNSSQKLWFGALGPLNIVNQKFTGLYIIFSSPEPSGSQCELIVYPWSGVRRPSASVVRRRPSSVGVVRRRPFTFSNVFSSETSWLIKAKFYMEPPWEGGTRVYINDPGLMTKMTAMLRNAQNLKKIFFSRTTGPIALKLGM